jgi:Coenzyme PQQ synthesis protein D (PqqD)
MVTSKGDEPMQPLSLESRVCWAKDVLFRNLDGEAVLVNLNTSTYFGLDPIGTRVWELIGERRRLADVLQGVLDEFDVTEDRARRDLLDLAAELMASDLICADDEQPR